MVMAHLLAFGNFGENLITFFCCFVPSSSYVSNGYLGALHKTASDNILISNNIFTENTKFYDNTRLTGWLCAQLKVYETTKPFQRALPRMSPFIILLFDAAARDFSVSSFPLNSCSLHNGFVLQFHFNPANGRQFCCYLCHKC